MSTLISRVGTEFLVNTETGSSQSQSKITPLASGGFVVSWTDLGSEGPYGAGAGIKAQIFDAAGVKVGGEFMVNIQSAATQQKPTITSLASGGFVVSWTDYSGEGGDTSSSGIKAQIFDAGGVKVGGEFLVNTHTADTQQSSTITSLTSGGFVVSWMDFVGEGYAVKAQVFNAAGVKVGGEFPVSALTPTSLQPAITSLASGGFVVTWTDSSGEGGDASGYAIKAQVFTAPGGKVGGEFLVNTQTLNSQERPTITSLASGGFVVSWIDKSGQGGDASESGIKAQIFDATGAKVGGEFLVNTQTANVQEQPAITSLPSGGFVVSWADSSGLADASGYAIKAQAFTGTGGKVGDEFLVNTQTAGYRYEPAITSLASGKLVISWSDYSGLGGDASGSAVKAQIFNLSGETITGPTEGDDRDAIALYGTAAGETIDGLGGHDQIFGLGGNDTLIGGLGDDELAGGLGADVLNGGAGKDTAVYSGALAGLRADLTTPSKNTGEAAGDTYSSIENLLGSDFNDTLVGNNSANILTGGKGNDSLQAGGDADILFGGEGDDNLQGQGGNDRLEGGAGNDTLTGGLGGKDWFIFNAPQWGADVITDYEANVDEIDLRGSGTTMAQLGIFQIGADVLLISGVGGGGVITVRNTTADQLIIRTDSPVTSLIIGLSSYSIAENSAAGTAVGALSTTTTGSNTDFTYQLLDDAGGRFVIQDDLLVATGTGLNFEAATSHNVQIKVTDGLGATETWTVHLQVSDVNEAPTAVALSNTLATLAENSNVAGGVKVADIAVTDDALGTNALGLTGADASAFEIRTEAGGAKALYYIGASPDFETKASYAVTVTVDDPSVGGEPDAQDSYVLTITDVVEAPPTGGATEGDDRGAAALYGTAVGETIDGLGGHDQIFGLGGNDTLIGGLGDDELAGGLGADVLNGGAGKDTAVYSGATAGLRADLMAPSKNTGEAAGDTYSSIENLLGSDFNDTLVGNNSANILTGGKGNDSLQAGGDADILFGGEGNDNLQGQGGNDRLEGGVGNDTLVGGVGGRDWFIFTGPDWGADVITDFEDNVDLLDLRGNGLAFAGLQMQQSGGDVLITAGTHGTILILDEQVANLTSSDFLF